MRSTSVVKGGHRFCYGRYLIKLRFSPVTDDGFTSFSSSGSHFMMIFPHEYSLPCWRAMLQCRSACLVSVLCTSCRFIRSQRGDFRDLLYY